MGRSPLFQDVQRTVRIAAWMERTGTSTAEGFERGEDIRWAGIDFWTALRAAAAATAPHVPHGRPG